MTDLREAVRERAHKTLLETPADGLEMDMEAMPEPPRLLEIADIELLIERHRRRVAVDAYHRGVGVGLGHGGSDARRRMQRAVKESVRALSEALTDALELLAQTLADREGRDRRSRADVRAEAEAVIRQIWEVRAVLEDFADLVFEP